VKETTQYSDCLVTIGHWTHCRSGHWIRGEDVYAHCDVAVQSGMATVIFEGREIARKRVSGHNFSFRALTRAEWTERDRQAAAEQAALAAETAAKEAALAAVQAASRAEVDRRVEIASCQRDLVIRVVGADLRQHRMVSSDGRRITGCLRDGVCVDAVARVSLLAGLTPDGGYRGPSCVSGDWNLGWGTQASEGRPSAECRIGGEWAALLRWYARREHERDLVAERRARRQGGAELDRLAA